MATNSISKPLSSTDDEVEIAAGPNGCVGIGVSGTFSGTLQFTGTIDGANYVSLLASPTAGGAAVSSATSTGLWQANATALSKVRVKFSAVVSGSAVVTLTAQPGVAPDTSTPGTDQDVNLAGINGVAPSATNPLSTTSPQNRPQVTLSLDTSAYGSGDVIADTQVITDALRVVGGTGTLQSLHVYDQDDQKAAFTVYLLRSNVSMGTENSAPSISDANALEILGWVSIAVGDYQDLGGVSVAQGIFSPFVLKSADASRDLYVAVVNGTGTPTYTASGIKIQFGITLD